MHIDVFNGDADGICALIQLRLAHPVESTLITGIKRDIALLQRVQSHAGDQLTVLDISLAKNHADLLRLLDQGAEVLYVDHHQPGDIPTHPALTTLIDTNANTCTSLLMDQHLQGQYSTWAITAAFGDNLHEVAEYKAKQLGLTEHQTNQLKQLGTCINYNGYGSSLEDLHFDPDHLYKEMTSYHSPFEFMQDNQETYEKLLQGYADDMRNAQNVPAETANPHIAVYILPDAIWSRRISGVFSNDLANQYPDRAHAILSYNKQGGYLISVRAPLNNKQGADELCSSFPSGGGRKAAAGINHLPQSELPEFIKRFTHTYS